MPGSVICVLHVLFQIIIQITLGDKDGISISNRYMSACVVYAISVHKATLLYIHFTNEETKVWRG